MRDLIEKLRTLPGPGEVMDAAADEIERLQKENGRLFGALNDYEATEQRLRAALREVLEYREGRGKYNYSGLTHFDRDNQAFDDWQEVEDMIRAELGANDRHR